MKIKTKLYLLCGIFVIVIMVIGFVMYHSFGLINREVKMNNIAGKLIKDIFELNIVTNEYVLHNEARGKEQWHAKYDSLNEELERLMKIKTFPETLFLLESIIKDYKSLGNLFTHLVENNEQQAETDMHIRIEKMLTNEIMIRSQGISTKAFKFSSMMQQKISQVEQRANVIVMFSIITFAVTSIGISFFIIISIMRTIKKLIKAAEIIGKGDLDHKVEVKTKDEIGQLAVSFDKMVEDLKKSNSALFDSEERYRGIFERVPVSIVSLDRNGQIIEVNPYHVSHVGKGKTTKEDYVGKNALTHPSVVNAGVSEIYADVLKGKPFDLKEVFFPTTTGGTASYFNVKGVPLLKDGDVIGALTMHEDVTESKCMEFALKESEEKYRQIVSTASDAVMVFDFETRQFVDVNKACEEVYGYTREEFLNMKHIEITVEAEHSEKTIQEAIDGTLYKIPLRYHRKKDGTVFPVEISVSGFVHKGRKMLCGMIRDITERKQAEKHLNTQHAVTKVLSESTTFKEALPRILSSMCTVLEWDLGEIWIFDPKNNELRCSEIWHIPSIEVPEFKAVTKHITFSPGIGLPGSVLSSVKPVWVADVVHDENFPRASVAAKEGLHGAFGFPILVGREVLGTISFYSHEIKQPDKDLLNMMTAIGSQIGFFIRRKRAEEQIKVSLKEKEVLLKEIHHRVKNNMQVMASLLRLQSEEIKDKHLLDLFNESQNRIKSMALIHEDLYSGKDLARIDFDGYTRKLTGRLMKSYEVEPNRIITSVNIDNVFLGVDTAIPCGLILNELFTNSLKYAFPVDKFGVNLKDKKGEIRIDCHSNSVEHTLVFSDNGVGLPEDIDFQKTETLGLDLVKSLTQQLGGTIEVNRNNGTEFKITFKV